MTRISIVALSLALQACAATTYTPEQHALAMRSDACENPKVVEKPVWCPRPVDRLQLPVETIKNPQGAIVNGRWVR